MKRGFAPLVIIAIVLAFIIVGGAGYFLGTGKLNPKNLPTPTPTSITPTSSHVACTQDAKLCPDGKTYVSRIPPSCNFAQCPPTEASIDATKPGWKTFTSDAYKFQVSYPPNYQALTDKNNLYGWPKAVVLIYSGGQSYDLPIEVWSSVAEYEMKYKDQPNLTVKQVNGKFITLMNVNYTPEVDEIIATFKTLP